MLQASSLFVRCISHDTILACKEKSRIRGSNCLLQPLLLLDKRERMAGCMLHKIAVC